MKNVKFFLVSWLFLHICIFLPSQGQAEENSVQDQNISEMNDQEGKNKEIQEQPEQVEMPSVEDEKKVVENEQVKEQKEERTIETDRGVITVNKQELKVGEEVWIAVEPNEKNIQSVKGILQLQKNGEQYRQERIISFEYEEKTKRWIANYKAGIYDLQGDWNLRLVESYKEDEKEEVIENELNVPLIRINNEAPTIDKELPKLEKVTIDEVKGNLIERKKGESVHIRVQTVDIESVVKEVRVILKGKEDGNDITFLLDYNKHDMDWHKIFEITEALPVGPHQLIVEVTDGAGNKLVTESEYIVSIIEQKVKDDEKIEEQENQKEVEDKKEIEKQEDPKIEISLPEEKLPVVQIPKQEEKVNSYIKEPLKEKEEINYVIKESLTDNKEVNNVKVHKEKKSENDNQVVSKKKEKIEEQQEKKEEKSEQGVQASNVFAVMSGLFVLFLVLKSNKEWG
ncbi:transglycosylase [Bacillus sp. TH44]|uniref:transglycosylase n=1 Tax=unclassified Bacillus (in: firmicutes) TaxID=185979 RepID=UPI00191462CF|nr:MULTISPECIES: transglycosylase [unclassified Bacillus (in: firmicutes)]MBK5346650.1 transglycosylase [Bacillus sp. TH45]MBK5357111.1 transglycosylase [Bacillus sp. TH44]MBK5366456.1 transglycosylase [Bacillus sp. TH50]